MGKGREEEKKRRREEEKKRRGVDVCFKRWARYSVVKCLLSFEVGFSLVDRFLLFTFYWLRSIPTRAVFVSRKDGVV